MGDFDVRVRVFPRLRLEFVPDHITRGGLTVMAEPFCRPVVCNHHCNDRPRIA